jgi:Flp pilus assembly pilin Flp
MVCDPKRNGLCAEREMVSNRMLVKFRDDDSGAVTVDWVVLTASIVGLVALAMAGLQGNMSSIGQKVENFMSSQDISTTF